MVKGGKNNTNMKIIKDVHPVDYFLFVCFSVYYNNNTVKIVSGYCFLEDACNFKFNFVN